MEYYARNDVLVLKPDTYADLSFKQEVQRSVLEQIGGEKPKVLVNCEHVELINSYGISALLTIYDRLDELGGTLSFSNVDSIMLENALEVSGLLSFCADHIYASEEQALAALSRRSD